MVRTSSRWLLAAPVAAACLDCGARSGLFEPPAGSDAGVVDAGAADGGVVDSGAEASASRDADASLESGAPPEGGPESGGDGPAEVGLDGGDDGPADGPSDAPTESGPDAPSGCTSDAQCDDGVACTVDTCDQRTGLCSHSPQNALCPTGFVCSAVGGCVAGGFAVSPTDLYTFEVPSGAVATVGRTGAQLLDVALHPDGTLYGVAPGELFVIDPGTGRARLQQRIAGNFNALDAAPDGTLYAATVTGDLYTLDPTTGAATFLLAYPGGAGSSGDLAIVGTTLYASTSTAGADTLIAIDLGTRVASVVGSIGVACVYGLASYGAALFGFTCAGQVLAIDTTTGAGSVLASHGPMYYGASAR